MTKTNKSLRITVITAVVISCVWAIADAQRQNEVDYPSGYRSWQHVKTMIIQPGHPLEDPFGGIHHVYANAEAMSGLSNNEYADGAAFAFDLLDYENSDRLIVETKRKRLDVMRRDSKKFADTGGWGYTTFVADSKTERLQQDVVTACFNCHVSSKNSGYVFSQYRP